MGRVDLDHSYYAVNISSDGKEVYIGGTLADIAVYDAETLEKLGQIDMPGEANQALATLRVIQGSPLSASAGAQVRQGDD